MLSTLIWLTLGLHFDLAFSKKRLRINKLSQFSVQLCFTSVHTLIQHVLYLCVGAKSKHLEDVSPVDDAGPFSRHGNYSFELCGLHAACIW